jgi:uncharacterized membrane protein YukC
MRRGHWLKYTKSNEATALAEKLMETGNKKLIEVSLSDKTWGSGAVIGTIIMNGKYPGDNLQGRVISSVRHRLRKAMERGDDNDDEDEEEDDDEEEYSEEEDDDEEDDDEEEEDDEDEETGSTAYVDRDETLDPDYVYLG